MAPKLKSISVSGFKSLGNVTLPTQLEAWIADYNGLGGLRADGELISVLADAVEPGAAL